MTDAVLRPRRDAPAEALAFGPDGAVPNHPRLPALLTRGAVRPPVDAAALEALYAWNGWGGAWRWQVYGRHHYHPNAHEVLTVLSGGARLVLGGPSREPLEVTAGDVIVLPAGTGHCQLAATPDFEVCGAYPRGQESYETVWAEAVPEEATLRRIAAVPLPGADPVFGVDGPLAGHWGLSQP